MKQRNSVSLLIIICCLCFVFTGCFKQDPVSYKVAVSEGIEHGSVSCDVSSATAGTTVTVTATPDKNYQLVSITVNGEAIEGNTFVMPEKDVKVSATFALAAGLTEAVPEGATTIRSQAAGGGSATGHFLMTFVEGGVKIEAYVEDATMVEKDGVAVLFSRELPKIAGLLPDGKTIKVAVNAKGVASVLATDADGVLQTAELAGVTTGFDTWSKNGEKLDGYHVEILVPYEALGVTAESAKGAITICPVLYSAYGSLPASSASLEGLDENAQNTFAVLTDDNTVRDNKYKMPSAQLGSAGNVSQGAYWDLSKDYYPEDENYANREAVLLGHDNNDNNVVFYGVSANEMYVKATLTLTEVINQNDQWPKFGLMLYDGAGQQGVFFFVDAAMSSGSGNTLNNITGNALGCNLALNGWGSWNIIKSNAFDLVTKSITMEMVYQNGWVHMYANGEYVTTVYYGEYDEDMHFGIKSFGLGVKVTDYLASADAEADGWTDKKRPEPDPSNIDILFAGDSYMDFWNTRLISNQLSYTRATYANKGVGGTKVQYWLDKATEMKQLYNPSKIAFHIGVNDIDDANAKPDAVLADLKVMFEKYHELFPDATIYWNSLIPNTMFASKYDDYKVINAGVVEYADNKDWLVYIDQTTVFDNNGAARPEVFDDGLHLSIDIGYPIWAKVMLTAMGYTRPDGATMGDIDGFSHTGLWTFDDEKGTAYSYGNADTALWFKNVSGENVYVEAVFDIGELRNGDGYPKFGLLVRNATESRWGIVDCVGYPNGTRTAAGLIYRGPTTVNGVPAQSSWCWDDTAVWGSETGCDYNNVKLAIAKLGDTVYFLVNDVIYCEASFTGEVVVGYESFNLETTISNVSSTTDATEIAKKLGLYCEDATIDGEANDNIWTEEVLANTIKFGDKGDGRYFTVAAAKGTDGVYFLVNTYTYENTRSSSNWWENANIEFRFGNSDSIQQYILVDGVGFNAVRTSGGITRSAIKAHGSEDSIYHNTFEFFAPFTSFTGYDESSEEIALKVWGWVWDSEGWNNIMNVGEWSTLTVSTHGLRFERSITVTGENAGVSATVQSTARKGDTVVATINVASGVVLDAVTVNGTPVDVVDGKITFTMPDENVVIAIKLLGISVTTDVVDNTGEGLSANINCETAIVKEGDTVTFTVEHTTESKLVSVTVNGNSVEAVEGVYSYTVQENDTEVAIVATLEYNLSEAIDGVRGENYGTPISFRVSDDRSVTVWARSDDYGVYIYAEAITNTVVNTASEWYTNTNFEFWLNGDSESAYVNILGWKNLASVAKFTYTLQDNGKYLNVVEFYVNDYHIRNEFNPDSVQFNYCFKVPGEYAYMEENANLRGHSTDWWRTHHTARWSENTDLGVWSEPNCIKITRNGLIHACDSEPDPKYATIDGDFSEYEGLAALTGLGNDIAKFDFTGFVADDGIYLAVTIYQNAVSSKDPNAWSDWSSNDNLEIQLNGLDAVCCIVEEGFVTGAGGLKAYAMVRTYDEAKTNGYYYTTRLELYYAYDSHTLTEESVTFKVGVNGEGIGGWQSLIWGDDVAYITKEGITK